MISTGEENIFRTKRTNITNNEIYNKKGDLKWQIHNLEETAGHRIESVH